MPAVLRVVLPVPLPQWFDYLPPAQGTATAGSRVLVPFGRSRRVGIVAAVAAESNVPTAQLKRAIRALDDAPLLDAE
jgi:primosomal protein N' (replication factor Y)